MLIDRRHFIASAGATALGIGTARATPPAEILLAARRSGDAAAGTPPLAYGGSPPGQVFRIKAGQETAVRLTNAMGVPTNIDWHGLRVPAGFEAVPGLGGVVTAPGAETRWTLRTAETGTYWLHPAYLPGWDDQTAQGLAAVLIVEEADPPAVDAERVLFLGDRPAAGKPLAEALSLNGKAWPQSEHVAPGARLRLRLVNGSTRQALAANFAGAQAFVIAIDGQPSELFRPLNDTVPLGPGARFDLMVDLPRRAGATFTLSLKGADAKPIEAGAALFVAQTDGEAVTERPAIHSLPPNPALPPVIRLEQATRAEISVASQPGDPGQPGSPARWSVNGASGAVLAAKPLFKVKRNGAVTLGVTNRSATLMAFRLHGHVMRLLHAKDDGWEPYWRDSVLVGPGMTVHVATQADNPGKWLIDSPFFEQATRGLRTWFEVV